MHQHASACVSICQHLSADAHIRQHTSYLGLLADEDADELVHVLLYRWRLWFSLVSIEVYAVYVYIYTHTPHIHTHTHTNILIYIYIYELKY